MEEPSRIEGTTYKDDSLSFRSLRKSCIIAARERELHGDATQNPLLVYAYEALELEQEHKEVPPMALVTEPEDLKKGPEPTATFFSRIMFVLTVDCWIFVN